MQLRDLHPGQRFRVKKTTLSREVGKRLADMGFINGVEGSVVRVAHIGDPIEVTILNYHVSIRKSEAAGIEVEVIH